MRLELPTIQNWSCHNCSGCCREHLIEVTEEERQRILQQNWSEQDGIPAGQPTLIWYAGPPWNKRYRLAHRADGACVFLNKQGLCRIHAKFGEAAKPLPCQVYPYAFHPAGKKVAVSLRYSCPSVVANKGANLQQSSLELKKMAKQIVPANVAELPAPKLTSRETLDWADFHRFNKAIANTIGDSAVPISVRLQRLLFWLNLAEQSRFDKLQGERLEEYLELITAAATDAHPEQAEHASPPSKIGQQQFRLLVAQYARKDTELSTHAGWLGRWNMLQFAWRFAKGTGNVPVLDTGFQAVPFTDLDQAFGPLPAEAEELFARYFQVKVQGIHYCGRAYYDVPLIEGARSLALVFPAVLWIARWWSLSHERTKWQIEDIAHAMTYVDHQHGYSPVFGQAHFRRRVRILSKLDDISKLITWYSR